MTQVAERGLWNISNPAKLRPNVDIRRSYGGCFRYPIRNQQL